MVEQTNTSLKIRKVDMGKEYIELRWAKDGTLICLLQSLQKHNFSVEFMDGVPKNRLKAAEKELEFYLVELNEPDPWKYAKYHCWSTCNLYSSVRWFERKSVHTCSDSEKIGKIVAYLNKYKDQLDKIYRWDFKIGEELLQIVGNKYELKLKELGRDCNPFQKREKLTDILSDALNHYDKSSPEFKNIALWIIHKWGRIRGSANHNNDSETMKLISGFLETDKPLFNRIASTSKVGAFKNPTKNIIYDSRVAYSMNWIILSQNAGNKFFPIPQGRNTKMNAFDLNVLVRLKFSSKYRLGQTENGEKRHIFNIDKELFIPEENAYYELNKLVGKVNEVLWDNSRKNSPFYTEMILFSIADSDVFKEITESVNISIKNDL